MATTFSDTPTLDGALMVGLALRMQGFLHNLFTEKWGLYGFRLHYTRLAFHALYLSMLLWLVFWLKADPTGCDRVTLPWLLIGFVLVLVATELQLLYLWLSNQGYTCLLYTSPSPRDS